MKLSFNTKQIALMKKMDIPFDVTGKLSEDQLFELENVVTEYLAYEGIDDNENVTEDGKICEEIIELLAQ